MSTINRAMIRCLRTYALALTLMLLAIGLRWVMAPLFDDGFRLIFLYGAVAFSVWFGGYRPALLVALLGYAISNYLFMGTHGSFDYSTEVVMGFLAYLLSCSIFIGLGEMTRRANRRIKEGDETLQTTLSSIVDAVIATDDQGRITRLNSAASSLTGWPAEAAMGRPVSDVFQLVNQDTESLEPLVSRALAAATVTDIPDNALLVDRNRRQHSVRGRVVPLPLVHGADGSGHLISFRDVTEEKRRAEQLARHERELSDFFDNAIFGILWLGPDGKILRANQAELDLLGYEREEYEGRHFGEFHLDPGAAAEMLERLHKGEVLQDYPATLRRKDGGIEQVLISCNTRFQEGKFVHSRCFTRAITAQKEAEETRARLAAIVAASDDAIVSKSLEGIIVSWNAGAQRLLGYTEAEMIGKSIYTIVPPELHEEETSIINRIRRGERVQHFDTVRLTKDGRRVDLSITVSPVFDDAGRVIGASKVARDVTQRKQAERHFRLMADAAPVLICTADTQKRGNWFNRQWLEFTGRSMKEELGDGWMASLHPDDYDFFTSEFHSSFDNRRPFTAEYRLRRRDGEYRWMLDKSLPLYGHAGEFVGYIGCCTDITDLKLAEETLQQADRRKDEFLATLAHELRNPLAPISHSLEILKHAEKDPALLPQCRDAIERQLNHMVRLVDDLLNVSRISRDKLTLRTAQTDLASVVQQAVETVQPVIQQFGHTLTTRLPDEPVYLRADPVRLAQVLSNLLNNACKYTRPGGAISLTVQQEADEVAINVRDNGVGIAPDQLSAIFEMFSQAHTELDHSTGGLGIGLTLAKRLVEMHGGRISAHSEGSGHGSEFTVHLPVLAQMVTKRPAAASQRKPVSVQRILVVDDNLDSADTLATLLRLGGHEVRLAHDGLAAIEAAAAFRPHLLLLDIGLPKLDGYGACREIRRATWGKAITIVALTGWGQEEDQRRSTEAGFDAHLVKPVNYEDVHRLLEKHAGEATG